jgi:hypothetical protein
MNRTALFYLRIVAIETILVFTCVLPKAEAQVQSIDPARIPTIGTVDERFLSYNVEMVEVIGGRFWKPYSSQNTSNVKQPQQPDSTPAGMDPNLYEYRPPIDLTNPRLRKLAAALGPAYVRVSGTWANSVYFADTDNPPNKAPAGFNGVLTRNGWKGVVDFAHATDAEIVTSFATSPGTRSARGVWTVDEARKWLAYTKGIGGRIAAAEFMNEPTNATMGGAPKGYNAADFGRDVEVFRPFLKQTSPETLLLGPGSVGEGPFAIAMGGMLKSEDLLRATGPVFDIFSYHLYAAASNRCASVAADSQTTAAAALSAEWLSRPEKITAFYADLRDRFEPGKPLWITETADAACGGNPWAPTFVDTFRYLVEHARLAQLGVKVIMHNTLASSDYGLLDENTFEPRPNYWVSLLWHKLMGGTVLDPKLSNVPNAYGYAQCLKGSPGGVSLLVINADQQRALELSLPKDGVRYTLTAKHLEDRTVQLNGHTLHLDSDGNLPTFQGQPVEAGSVTFAPASITFLTLKNANNANCR